MSRPSTFMKRSQELGSQTTKTSLAKWFQGQQKRQYMKTCRNCCIISKFMSRWFLHVWPCFVKEANVHRIEIKYGICSMLSSFTTYYYTTCLHWHFSMQVTYLQPNNTKKHTKVTTKFIKVGTIHNVALTKKISGNCSWVKWICSYFHPIILLKKQPMILWILF